MDILAVGDDYIRRGLHLWHAKRVKLVNLYAFSLSTTNIRSDNRKSEI